MTWAEEMASLNAACDDAFGCSVTISRNVKGALNTSTGVRANTTTNTSATALRGRSRVEGEGKSRIETVMYRVTASQLAFTPDTDDKLIDGAMTFTIGRVEPSVDRTTMDCTCSRTL